MKNREIKFRAWYGGKMSPWGLFTNVDKTTTFIPPIDLKCPQLQFTGLLDKNKKEVWEGDIIRVLHLDGEWIVEYRDTCAGFVLTQRSHLELLGVVLLGVEENNVAIEVIGNIYENSEFLTN